MSMLDRQGGASAGPLEITELKIHQHWIAVGTQHGHIFVFDHFQVSEKGGLGTHSAFCWAVTSSSRHKTFVIFISFLRDQPLCAVAAGV